MTAPTTLSTNQRLSTNLSNVSSIENPSNQSNATLVPPPSNQSNASVPIVTNSSFDTAESNGTITIQNNTPSLNTSSSQATENSSTAPSVQELNNNTSLNASTDNTINNNPPPSTSTQNNDTSNNKKSSEKIFPLTILSQMIRPTTVELTKDNTTQEIAQNESNKPISDAKVKNKDTSSNDSETQSTQNSCN